MIISEQLIAEWADTQRSGRADEMIYFVDEINQIIQFALSQQAKNKQRASFVNKLTDSDKARLRALFISTKELE